MFFILEAQNLKQGRRGHSWGEFPGKYQPDSHEIPRIVKNSQTIIFSFSYFFPKRAKLLNCKKRQVRNWFAYRRKKLNKISKLGYPPLPFPSEFKFSYFLAKDLKS